MSELKKATWKAVKALDAFKLDTPLESARDMVEPLRAFVTPGIHAVRGGNPNLSKEQVVEWYAGQLLNIVDTNAWFAMNSILNCAEKFLGPEK